MTQSSFITTLTGFALFLLLHSSARAEIAVAESIEWVLANSDRVVVGTVAKVDKAAGSDNKDYQAVTVNISQTLKGAETKRETFLLHHYLSRSYAQQWLEEDIPLLFCLIKNDGKCLPFSVNEFPWVLREDHNNADAVLLGKSKHHWTGCIKVLTRDFEVLREKRAVLKYVEKAINQQPKDGGLHSHVLSVPSDTEVYKELWSGSAVHLVVPIDQNLEMLGRSWCAPQSSGDRREGARILRHFKNDQNIAILGSLLNDPDTSEETLSRSAGNGKMELVYRKKIYHVRKEAYEALHDWGVAIDSPVLEELLEGRDEPNNEESAIGASDRWKAYGVYCVTAVVLIFLVAVAILAAIGWNRGKN
jgi:hypothetical protein